MNSTDNDYINTDLLETGEKIRFLRESKGMSQEQLAELVGVSKNSIHRYENGTVEMKMIMMFRIAFVLEVSPYDLTPSRYRVSNTNKWVDCELTFWNNGCFDEFRNKFLETKYHCLPHTSMLLRQAAKLSQNEASDFVSALATSSDLAFNELIGDVEWFTLKFDYRNSDKPWGNSKNAIQRSMRFLSADRRDFDEQLGKKQS